MNFSVSADIEGLLGHGNGPGGMKPAPGLPILGRHGKWQVNMDAVFLLATTLAAGLTLSGLTCTILELVDGQPVSLRRTVSDVRSALRHGALAALGGPLMLLSDALIAWRAGGIRAAGFAALAAVTAVWSAASGVLALEVLRMLGQTGI